MITVPGDPKKLSPGKWPHYNPSMRGSKGLYGFPGIKVPSEYLFQTHSTEKPSYQVKGDHRGAGGSDRTSRRVSGYEWLSQPHFHFFARTR